MWCYDGVVVFGYGVGNNSLVLLCVYWWFYVYFGYVVVM